jgi:hypothetical protein
VTRWNRRLIFGAAAMLVPVLAGCEAGANAPTLTFHPASSGVSVVQNGISVDNAFVLGPTAGSTLAAGGQASVFLALFAPDGDRLESITAPGSAASVKITGGSVNLPQQQLVTLEGPAPKIVLTGLTSSLLGGQTVQLVLNFAEAAPITISVPVEPRSYDYATYSPPAIPTATASASATGQASPGATASTGTSVTASASPTATP